MTSLVQPPPAPPIPYRFANDPMLNPIPIWHASTKKQVDFLSMHVSTNAYLIPHAFTQLY